MALISFQCKIMLCSPGVKITNLYQTDICQIRKLLGRSPDLTQTVSQSDSSRGWIEDFAKWQTGVVYTDMTWHAQCVKHTVRNAKHELSWGVWGHAPQKNSFLRLNLVATLTENWHTNYKYHADSLLKCSLVFIQVLICYCYSLTAY